MIRVKYICETDGYKLYVSSSGQFLKTYISQSFDSSDEEIGSHCYGMYVYSGSEGRFIAD
tara:strand:- start:632 stop:811 length:180 start_codon:yes stop_codon:yes gene_type:complete